jgi:hypothetical protein
MNESKHESVARRAYQRGEEQGRSAGRNLASWLPPEAEEKARGPTPATGDWQHEGPAPSNLDRALPAGERRRARAARRGTDIGSAGPGVREPEHFVAVLDRAHLNIYQVRNGGRADRARLEPVEIIELPAGNERYTERDTDQAGRFGARFGPGGGSIDERLPMQNEHERRLAADLAARLGRFLEQHDGATWDYAAGPALHHAVLDRLPSWRHTSRPDEGRAMDQRDLSQLNGQSVLVKSTADHRDPPVALRGTIEARTDRAGTPVVKIVLDYPDMNNRASHAGVLSLDGAGMARLMAGRNDGTYEYTIDQPLEPGPEAAAPRADS